MSSWTIRQARPAAPQYIQQSESSKPATHTTKHEPYWARGWRGESYL